MIEIDLDNKLEYLNKYDDNVINDELHKYILNVFDDENCDVLLKIKFNYKIDDDDLSKVALIFRKSFSVEFDDIQRKIKKQNMSDAILLLLGFLFLIIYCCLEDFNIFLVAEFFLVISWVAFWEFAESVLFYRKKLVINRKKYKKLMSAEIKVVS